MPERIPENNSSLNQKSKQFLIQEKAEWSPMFLYCLQLAEWALSQGELKTDPRLRDNLEGFLYHQTPQIAMMFLEQAENGEEDQVLNDQDLKELKDPVELAYLILDQLDSKLKTYIQNYPTVKLLP